MSLFHDETKNLFKMQSVYSKNLQSHVEVMVLYLGRDNSISHSIRSPWSGLISLVIFPIETVEKTDIFILKIHVNQNIHRTTCKFTVQSND